jgi:hypothetical protein
MRLLQDLRDEWTSLDACQLDAQLVKPANQCLGLAGNLHLPQHPSRRIHDNTLELSSDTSIPA